jgi:hypothetical protein
LAGLHHWRLEGQQLRRKRVLLHSLDPCVQLIGYSGISGSIGYWIIRNSWADDWGVDGMIHLEYGANTCVVADEATVVTLK